MLDVRRGLGGVVIGMYVCQLICGGIRVRRVELSRVELSRVELSRVE